MKLEIGQKVFIKKIGNAARRLDRTKANLEAYIDEASVSKIGRRWFTVHENDEKFDIETGYNDGGQYTSNYIAYGSKQDIYDEQEASEISDQLRQHFGTYGRLHFSLSKLRRIKAIVDEIEINQ